MISDPQFQVDTIAPQIGPESGGKRQSLHIQISNSLPDGFVVDY